MSTHADLDDLVRRLVEAWNKRDEQVFALFFTPASEYVTGRGERVCGRDAIAGLVRTAPALQVRVVGEPEAECDASRGTVTFKWVAAQPSESARRGKITCVLARRAGGWLIEALQNGEDDELDEPRGSPTRR